MPESTGTITLTNGSASVAGSETKFAANFVGPNDLLIVGGSIYIVKSVASDTALTLTREYAGETESGMTYDIVRTEGEQALNELAQQVAELVNKYRTIANAVQEESGAYKIPMAGEDGTIDAAWIPSSFVNESEFQELEETLTANAKALEESLAADVQALEETITANAQALEEALTARVQELEETTTAKLQELEEAVAEVPDDIDAIFEMLISGSVKATLLDDDGNALAADDGALLIAGWAICSHASGGSSSSSSSSSSGVSITAGSGLSLTGNVMSVNVGSGLGIDTSNNVYVDADSIIGDAAEAAAEAALEANMVDEDEAQEEITAALADGEDAD